MPCKFRAYLCVSLLVYSVHRGGTPTMPSDESESEREEKEDGNIVAGGFPTATVTIDLVNYPITKPNLPV